MLLCLPPYSKACEFAGTRACENALLIVSWASFSLMPILMQTGNSIDSASAKLKAHPFKSQAEINKRLFRDPSPAPYSRKSRVSSVILCHGHHLNLFLGPDRVRSLQCFLFPYIADAHQPSAVILKHGFVCISQFIRCAGRMYGRRDNTLVTVPRNSREHRAIFCF